MERRKIRDAADARACVAALKASGLTQAAWCRSAGVDGRSLRGWTLKLGRGAASARKRARPARTARLVELIPVTPTVAGGRYTVHVGLHRVEVDAQFEERTLRRLVQVLSSC